MPTQINRSQTTGRDLDAEDAFEGLVDFGLFNEKVPSCFSSKGLVRLIPPDLKKIVELAPCKLKERIESNSRGFIHYQVLRAVNTPRYMGIPHPQSYIVQCLAIKRCWDEIKKHCAKPTHPVSRIFVRDLGGERVFEMNYTGSDNFELQEQEVGFMTGACYVVRADISACFPSIYTHSIPWAMHTHIKAKKKRHDLSLEGNILDKATQGVSGGQTNGLLIGPHTSNVISEIVLTSIDKDLIDKNYTRLIRNIDDYTYYAKTHDEAKDFIQDLSMALRKFDLLLNERKTKILPLPQPKFENWLRELRTFQFPTEEIYFSSVREFLDLSLCLAKEAGTSAVLNYAIKMIPSRLNTGAKRLFVQEAVNLALSFPYLAPLLEDHVFKKHPCENIKNVIATFSQELVKIGIQRTYPDAIGYGLYYAIKHNVILDLQNEELEKVVKIDDCICHVLLLEYATRRKLSALRKDIRKRANDLKKLDPIDQDPFWLLIYQVWSEPDLQDNEQVFLAKLKSKKFSFVHFK